jgi:hypothetical protein
VGRTGERRNDNQFLLANTFKIRPPNVQEPLRVIMDIYAKLINVDRFRVLHDYLLDPMAVLLLTYMMIIIRTFNIFFQFINQSFISHSPSSLHLQDGTSGEIYGRVLLVDADANETCDNYSFFMELKMLLLIWRLLVLYLIFLFVF